MNPRILVSASHTTLGVVQKPIHTEHLSFINGLGLAPNPKVDLKPW